MEDNVALDSSKQKKFVKSINKLIKKKKEAKEPEPEKVVDNVDKAPKKAREERGLVYLSHIPHGFYEHEMTQYFKQFGKVTNVRVIRSKKTGNSKGCAFIEFGEPAVAEIVGETMNNYLMGKRLLKAVVIPPEKQRRNAKRKNWSSTNNPALHLRLKETKAFNAKKTDEEELKRAKKLLKGLRNIKSSLEKIGIDYDFFNPVDIPEQINYVKSDVKVEDKVVKEKKVKKTEQPKVQSETKKSKKLPAKPVEDFIKVNEDESDESSVDFDSDEFDKMQEFDSDNLDSSIDEEVESSEEEELPPPPKKKALVPAKKVNKPKKAELSKPKKAEINLKKKLPKGKPQSKRK